MATPITIARGDGIGPEIMEATLKILDASGADLTYEEIQIGEQVYLRGISSGIEESAWESLRRTKVFLKAPITTPQGGGYKSLNVTTRKTLGLFANVRPCRSYHPFIDTKHPVMDVVIIRENEEDLYAGIEHRQTDEVYQTLKLVSRPGTEKIIRYAFDYAQANGRKKVTCFSKDNIMKLTDGLFHSVFDEVAKDYPDIEPEHWIIDIGAAKLADSPEVFDVIVTGNLYGDIISDIAAQIAGSVGIAGSANIGQHAAMFEAIHGSAPRRAGQNLANPSGLLQGAIQMLHHVGMSEAGIRVENAWLKTLEDGYHTYDIYEEGTSKAKVGTQEFAAEVVARMGEEPKTLKARKLDPSKAKVVVPYTYTKPTPQKKQLVGSDMFVEWPGQDQDELARKLQAIVDTDALKLVMISNRGTKIWPDGAPETFKTDHWRCRFRSVDGNELPHEAIAEGLSKLAASDLKFIKCENLYLFDGEEGFSKSQGQ